MFGLIFMSQPWFHVLPRSHVLRPKHKNDDVVLDHVRTLGQVGTSSYTAYAI